MKLPHWKTVILVQATLLGAVACQQQSPSEKPAPEPSPFEEALMLGEIHPLADGAAYLDSYHGLYYLRAGMVEEVSGLPADSYGDLTALADGSAVYLLSFADPPRLFWLRGATATAIEEGEVTTGYQPSPTREGFYFAESQRLQRQLDEAASELAAAHESDEPYYEPEPY